MMTKLVMSKTRVAMGFALAGNSTVPIHKQIAVGLGIFVSFRFANLKIQTGERTRWSFRRTEALAQEWFEEATGGEEAAGQDSVSLVLLVFQCFCVGKISRNFGVYLI